MPGSLRGFLLLAALATVIAGGGVHHIATPAQRLTRSRTPGPTGKKSDAVANTRLTLRGGGLPLVPMAIAAGAGVTLKVNEGLRERVMNVFKHISFGQDSRRRPGTGGIQRRNIQPRATKSAVAEETKVVRSELKSGYDLRNGTWAYELDKAEPGCLLVASPDTFRFAGQRQVLDQAVVLLVRHGPTGSSGFIINRPTAFTVGDVTKKLENFDANPLFLGGDIGEGVYMIHGFPGMTNATEVSEGIFYGGSEEAMDMVKASNDGTAASDFRFFFKYTAWAPGQLDAEIQGGCWCPIRSSLDLILRPRVYQGLHIAKYHKVFWHQVLKTLGGRFDNISTDTIHKEEGERLKLEEWVAVLGDERNATVEAHENVELGALTIASVTKPLQQADAESVILTIRDIAQRVSEGLKGEPVTPQQALEALSKEFFTTFSLVALETEADSADPDSVLITNVAKNKRGTALGLSPLYLAAARLIGAPLRVVNCSAAMKDPFDFLVRWDSPAGPDDKSMLVNLQKEGAVMKVSDGLSQLKPGSVEADLNPVPHVQLYSRFMHLMADAYSKKGDESQVLAWLAQLRVLQGAINTRLIMSEQAAGNFEGNALELLGTSLVGKGGKEVAVSSLQGKVVALYFSASWCGPCKAFTPALTSLYETLKAKGKEFEVVFVSLDRSQEGFDQYFETMPWLAVPFSDSETRTRLGQQMGIDSIPKLVVIDEEGGLLTPNGRELVTGDPKGDKFPWKAEPAAEPEEAKAAAKP